MIESRPNRDLVRPCPARKYHRHANQSHLLASGERRESNHQSVMLPAALWRSAWSERRANRLMCPWRFLIDMSVMRCAPMSEPETEGEGEGQGGESIRRNSRERNEWSYCRRRRGRGRGRGRRRRRCSGNIALVKGMRMTCSLGTGGEGHVGSRNVMRKQGTNAGRACHIC
jgi:hypothetical protein